MANTSPTLDITLNENDEWCITTSTLLRTVVVKFTLGIEYEEHMPGGVIKVEIFFSLIFSLYKFNFRAQQHEKVIT